MRIFIKKCRFYVASFRLKTLIFSLTWDNFDSSSNVITIIRIVCSRYIRMRIWCLSYIPFRNSVCKIFYHPKWNFCLCQNDRNEFHFGVFHVNSYNSYKRGWPETDLKKFHFAWYEFSCKLPLRHAEDGKCLLEVKICIAWLRIKCCLKFTIFGRYHNIKKVYRWVRIICNFIGCLNETWNEISFCHEKNYVTLLWGNNGGIY